MAVETESYRHGGNPLHDFQRLGVPPRPVIDFSVNINPLGPPTQVMEAWAEWRHDISRYPSPDGEGVLRFYEERFALPRESVVAGNGSTELIYLLPRALSLKTAAVQVPSFHDYSRSMLLNGGKVVELGGGENTEEGWAQNIGEILPRVQALFIGNPNNPTGQLLPAEKILETAERFPDKWFLVDEAFIQFVETPERHSLLSPQKLRKNIVVFHSLTKFYALAGLRIGAAISHPETIAKLRGHKEPWSVSLPAERTAELLSTCSAYEENTRALISREREMMASFVRESSLMEALPPAANFVLARWIATPDLDDLLRALLQRGLYIRDARNFSGLSDNWFRFAILGEKENELLRRAFLQIEKEVR
jgi:threonine-phosphate decarboxylase